MRAVLTSDVPCVRSLLLEAIGASCGSDRVALYLREGEQLIASSISGLDDPDLLEPLPCQFFPDAKEKWRMGPSPPPWKDAIAWLFPLFLGGKIEGLIILAGDARGLPDPALAAPLRALADLATLLLVGDGVIHGASDRASGSTFS